MMKRRWWLWLAVGMGWLWTGSGLQARPAIMTVDQIKPGMKGIGKTVFHGTEIEEFKVTVLGVLEGFDLGLDLILIRIDSGPVVDQGWGLCGGMSGSPIYIDGKLIGAIAYGLSLFPKSPLAGVTPISAMLDATASRDRKDRAAPGGRSGPATPSGAEGSPASGRRLRLRGGPLQLLGQTFHQALVFATDQQVGTPPPGTLAFTPIATPLMVNGLGARGQRYLEKLLEPFPVRPQAAVNLGPAPPEAVFHLEPGAAVGVQLCRGAVDITAIGTLTYLDGDTVLAFGHPMLEFGAVDMPLTGAYIHTVWPSYERSNKVGSPLAPIGSILEDRLPAVGGLIGRLSEMLPADFTIRDTDRGLTRHYHLEVMRHRRLTAGLLSSLLSGAVDATTTPMREGVTRLHLEVQPRGYPPIVRENLFSSATSAFYGGSALVLLLGGSGPDGEVASILDTLAENPFGEVRVESVRAQIEVREEHRTAELVRVYPAKTTVKPGETIDLAVYLKPYEQPEEVVHLPFHVPENAPAGRAILVVVGGESGRALKPRLGRRDPIPINLDQLLANLRKSDRNDELMVLLHLPTVGLEMEGVQLADMPLPIGEALRAARARNILPLRDIVEEKHPQDRVLSGGALIPLTIKADEPDKVKAALGPAGPRIGGEEEEGGETPPGTQVVMVPAGRGGDAVVPFLAAFERLEAALNREALDPLASGTEDPGAPSEPAESRPAPSEPLAEGKESGPNEGKEEIPDLTEALDLENGPAMPTWEEVQSIEWETAPGEKPAEKVAKKSQALARSPQVWEWRTVADFAKGEFKGTYLTGKGQLSLAPDFQALPAPPAGLFWKQVQDAQGNLYVGSWAPGMVCRIAPDGSAEPYFKSEEMALPALAIGPDGTLYAAGLPSGKIYKITAAQESTVLATLPEKYIWELVCLANGDLYAATGNQGKLYRITPDGTVSVAFTARDRHLLALAVGPDQTLYVGTYPNGKVYRIVPGSETATASAVYEVPDAAVLSLAVTGEGRLYIGTSPKGTLYKMMPDGSVQPLDQKKGEANPQTKSRHIFQLVPGPEGVLYAATGSPGRIYRIDPDDTVSTLYDPEEDFVLALALTSEQALSMTSSGAAPWGRFHLIRRQRGEYLSEVRDAGFLSRWGQLRWKAELPPGTQVTLQTRSGNTRYPDGSWSDWSEESAAASGTPVTSPPARFLQYRACLYGSPEGTRPVLQQVQLFHLGKNRAPRLTEVTVGKQSFVSGKVNVRWTAKDPDNDTLTYESFYSSDGKTWKPLKPPKEEKRKEAPGKEKPEAGPEEPSAGSEGATAGGNEPPEATEQPSTEATGEPQTGLSMIGKQGARMGTGLAQALQAAPDQEAESEESKAPEESGTEAEGGPAEASEEEAEPEKGETGEAPGTSKKTSVEWDTTQVPDGQYWIRVTVTDRTSNPQEWESDEKVSDPFIVDNTPPVILLNAGPEAIAPPQTVQVSDAATYVASAEWKVDQGEWTGAACADRVFDSPYEDILLDLGEVKPGEHTLSLRVRDAAGNEAIREFKIVLPEPPAKE